MPIPDFNDDKLVVYDADEESAQSTDARPSPHRPVDTVEYGVFEKIHVGENVYAGPYEATPTEETQYLNTALQTTMNNIKINPIPTNYGKITWDGSKLKIE